MFGLLSSFVYIVSWWAYTRAVPHTGHGDAHGRASLHVTDDSGESVSL